MYLKYEAINIDSFSKIPEIAMFEGISYDINCGNCRISFIGNFVDILQPMSESEYSELVYTIVAALSSNLSYLELSGKWIFDFEDDYEEDEWESMFQRAKNILS